MESSLPEPSSPVAVPIKPIVAYPTIKQSWGILGWYLLLGVLIVVPVCLLFFGVFDASKELAVMLAILLQQAALLALVVRKAGRWQARIKLIGHEMPWLYVALPVLMLAQFVLLLVLEFLHLPNLAENMFREMSQRPILAFFVLCIAGPVLEELIFRGVVLNGLLRNYRPWVAIGQSALLFGVYHLNPAQVVAAGIGGLLLGWLYYRTRSLWLCIVAHTLNNLIGFVVLVNPSLRNIETGKALFGSDSAYVVALLLSILLVSVILWRVQQTTNPIEREHALVASEAAPAIVAAVETQASSGAH